ncbi:hypothetical protein ACFWFK_23375 [Micromonospora chalcea]
MAAAILRRHSTAPFRRPARPRAASLASPRRAAPPAPPRPRRRAALPTPRRRAARPAHAAALVGVSGGDLG